MSKLLIVESPTKVKSIKKYLGSDYTVMASQGHIRDLPKSKFGIDVNKGFMPEYINMADKKDLIKSLKSAASECDEVFLATDPDREGEAISWHLAQILALDLNNANRVTFNEITKSGVQSGIKAPRKIDMDLVDAQQARRVLDRIVGYKLSPFLWKKVKSGLSAGRVQTVALRLIVEREKEIEKFVEQEYWTVDAKLASGRKTFVAKLYGDKNGKIDLIPDKASADEILQNLEDAVYTVSSSKKAAQAECALNRMKEQLKELHLELPEELEAFHGNLLTQRKAFDLKYKKWLKLIISQNKKYKVYDSEKLEEVLWKKWAEITYFGLRKQKSVFGILKIVFSYPVSKMKFLLDIKKQRARQD